MRIESGFTAIQPVADSPRASGGGFAEAIQQAMDRVDNATGGAQSAAADLLVNGRGDVHTVALAAQSAELSMELFQQVRNKFVSAYQEIMKMPM
jgi:flagellar hook-basal body complex protein FliE